MAKYVCSICGYVHEGTDAPEKCPICLTSASDFTIIEDVSDETLQEESNVGDVVSSETVKNNVEITTDNDNSTIKEEIDPVEEAIIDKFQETQGLLQVVNWYKETYDVDLKEAKDFVEKVLVKHNLWNMSQSGSGCAVTLLVAITSTLSLFVSLFV
jgi:ribosomal protein L7/L12